MKKRKSLLRKEISLNEAVCRYEEAENVRRKAKHKVIQKKDDRWGNPEIDQKVQYDDMRTRIRDFVAAQPSVGKDDDIPGFMYYLKNTYALAMKEKEIFTFSIIQWIFVAAAYYIWVQLIGMLPREITDMIQEPRQAQALDSVLLVLSFFCVGFAAFPLGLLTACTGTVYYLKRRGSESTIASCCGNVITKILPLWSFQWMDGWITVKQIYHRIPKRGQNNELRLEKEVMYNAWKLATIGLMPAIILGTGPVEACYRSFDLVRKKFREVMKLRLGYSAACWAVGAAAFGIIILVFYVFKLVPKAPGGNSYLYNLYFWAGIPVLLAVAIVIVVIRPAYIIGSCDIYAKYADEQGLDNPKLKNAGAFASYLTIVILMLLFGFVAYIWLDKDALARFVNFLVPV